jgi:hypothetical protein
MKQSRMWQGESRPFAEQEVVKVKECKGESQMTWNNFNRQVFDVEATQKRWQWRSWGGAQLTATQKI